MPVLSLTVLLCRTRRPSLSAAADSLLAPGVALEISAAFGCLRPTYWLAVAVVRGGEYRELFRTCQ